MTAKSECQCCYGSGRVIRDPDIGTDQECFVCEGLGIILDEEPNTIECITPLMEDQMYNDWCPYKGNPDPRTVWAAAIQAVNGLLLGADKQEA